MVAYIALKDISSALDAPEGDIEADEEKFNTTQWKITQAVTSQPSTPNMQRAAETDENMYCV